MFKLKRTTQTFFACTLWHLAKRGFVVSVLSVLLLPLFFLTRGGVGVPHAYAATSDNLNFQARLETTAGAIAPDGDYNIQFKLYDALSGGTLLWTETYYDSNGGTAGNDNRVRVANGYVTVNLGSQTAFPGTMPWDQQLYLTMNVGGTTQTATPTWDGEMSPRLKLTAVPYAFNAKTASQIVSSSGANLASLSIAAPTSGNQTFTIQDQGAAGSYNILTQTQINAGFIQNQFGAAQTTSNFWLSGTGRADTAFQAPLFDSSTAAALGVGTTNATSISIGKSTITTTVQGPFVANGSQFTNNGSTLLTGSTLSDFAASGAIGTAATTVDVYTTFVIPQTTAGRTLSLPTPTTGTAGRLAYVLNTGSTPFTMHSVSIQAGKAQTYIYDGSAWTATNIDGAGNGVTFIGTIDSQTKSADGAVISGNGIYLQTADGTNPGLVSTGIQTFAGNKTFSGTVTATAGGSIYGGTINLNANSNFDTNINTGTSTGAVAIGNSAAGNISVQSGGTISVLGTTSINTTGTATTTIGSATAGAVSITSNAASNFTTNTGALTLTSAAAATWGTNAGLLTLQGAGGATVTSTAGTTSSNTTISTGNASAGASGNIVIDTGTATTTAGTVSIGTTNASGVTIGRATTTTTIQGNTVITLSATTGSTFVCQNGSSQLATCTSMPLTSSTGIQNQNASQQATSNFWISGTGRADTSILTPLVDTATAVALNIGTTNATQINLNKNVSIAANQNITFAAGTGSFDQSASSGTFKTGTGAVSLNGDTTVATGKNLTVTSGSTALNGQTTIAASIAGPLLTVNQSGAGNILNLQNAGTNVLSVTSTGATSIVTTTASNSEFSIRTGGTYLFNFDSTNRITVDNGTITPDNLLENPGFESDASAGFSGWSLSAYSTIESANPHTGDRDLAVTADGTTHAVADSKYYTAVPGETFYLEGWTKNASGTTGSASLAITYYDASNSILSGTQITANNTTSYGKVSGTGTAPANTAYIRVRTIIDNSSTTGTWYFDDLYFAKVSQSQPLSIRPTTNATNILEVQNAAGTQIFAVNTTSGTATIQGNTILTSTTGIQLQATTPGTAQTGHFNISGTGIASTFNASTSVLTPLVDTATAVALNIGTTNATAINLNQDTVLAAGQSITITGGNTASRPASPTEGMVYYDTTTKQLLVYANGKWQADRSTATKIVGTSASGGASSAVASQNYDAADYVNTSTTNAETVINNALTAVGSAGGGTVYLMEGTYVVSASVAIPNNVTLVGAGAGTVLKFANATNLSVGLIQNSDTTNGHHVTVHHLTLDGNKSNQSSGSALGILFAGLGTGTTTVGTHIYDIWVGNFTDVGIKFTTVSRSSITGVSSYNNNNNGLSLSGASYISVTGNNFSDNTNTNASGISLSGTALNNTITGNILNNNGGTGISVTASSAGNTITGNTANYNVTSGISLSNALNNTISANTVRGSGAHGIRVSTSSNNTISGNTVDDNGQTSANNDAIIILNNSLSNLVTDNKLTDTAGTGYAIEIQAGSNTNTIGSNLIGTGANGVWNGSGAITDLATGTIWQNQTDNSGNLRNSTANTSGYFYNNSTTAATIVSRLQTGSTQDLFQAQDGTGATVLMRVTSAGALQAPSLDTTTGSTALAIGSTNATSVTIAKSTVNTTVASNTTYLGTNNGTIVLSAVAQTGAATGNGLTIKAGTGGTGNQNGGTLALSGGDASGTGVKGLVTLNPTAFTGTSQNCSAASCSITAATVDANSTALVNNTYAGSTVTLADPTITTAGRVLYVTNSGTQDMTLSVNGGGTGNTIALKPNTTATMFWNGVDWTAAGASSATDLQAAYNNTQSTAGGAEIVLKSTLDTPAGTGGMTIRNNSGLPISGGLLEVQTSIGTNLFSVNSYGTELASNGGAETAGGSATTFPSSTWSAQSTATVSRTITSGEYQTGEAGVKVVTTGSNQGVRNQLTGNPVASTTYTVSFTAASTTAGQFTTPIEVIYSPDNGTTLTNICQGYGLEGTTLRTTFRNISNATNYNWTKVTCTVTTTGAAVTTPLLIVRQTDATARTIYIDNLSFIRNDSTTRPANVQMGGGNTGGQVTLFTLDRSSTAPLVSNGDDRYIGSMYYDTTLGNIQCYEADGWGACGSAPDNIITYTPEYTGAVLNGTGVGTMTADFCGNGGGLSVNTGFCASGEARNYYRWTSPQASDQTYSIYVSYRLPSTFKEFESGTTSLISLVDNTSNASVKYAIFKKTSTGGLTSCSADATMSGTVSTWNSTTPTTDLGTGACHTGGATPFAAGDTMVVRITVSAKSNASAYVENLTFRYSNK